MKLLFTILFLLSFSVSASPYYTPSDGMDGATGATGPQGIPGTSLDYMPEINLQFSGDAFEIAGGGASDFRSNSVYAIGAGFPLCNACDKTYIYGQYKNNLKSGIHKREEGYVAVTWEPDWKW